MRHEFSPWVLAFAGASSLAWGQPVPTLATISVTAKGYAADELETPLATTTVERDTLLRRGAITAGDALRGEPGLAVASDSAQGQNPVIRGLKKESVVLLVDGMRLNSAQPQGAIASFMSAGLAQRVEVVKGPASVLYGTGALGGAINVRLPQAQFGSGVAFEASSGYDSASHGLNASGVVNLGGEQHALMLGASAARIGDYAAPSGEVARTGYGSESAIGQYRFRIDASQQLRASVQRHTDRDVWYPGSNKPHANTAVVGSTTVHAPRQSRELTELGYSRTGTGSAPLNLDVRLYRQDVQRAIDSYAEKLGRDIAKTQVRFATDGLDVKADWLVQPEHLLSMGVNAWNMGASPDRVLANPTPLSPLVRNLPFEDGRIQALGYYLQDDMRLGALNVLAGVRHDSVTGTAASINNGAQKTALERTDSATSGSLAAIYEASPLLRPYASVSQAFRAGEMRERFEASPRGDGYHYLGNPQIRPEWARQLELGVKGGSDAVLYSLSAYTNRITDYITGRPTGQVLNGLPVKQTVNLGEVVLAGLEAQARWQIRPRQWLTVAYSQVRGDNKDLNEPLFQMPADELTLGWSGALVQGWGMDATLRLVDAQNRVATQFAKGSENATAGFATADVGVTYQWARQSLRVGVKNLADKAYFEHLTEGVSGRENLAPGRSLVLAWTGKF